MSPETIKSVFLDALKDSALVFAFIFIFHIILSVFEDKIANSLSKNKKIGPLFGSLFGLIPQCGTSVLGADLYLKKYISLGTLTAIFLSCSDEALIILLTNPNERTWMVIPLIFSKFLIGFLSGIVIDLLFKKQIIIQSEQPVSDVTCEDHHHKDTKLHKHLLHPLIHAFEIFLYVFIINVVLGLIIASVGEETFTNFMISNKYLTPLFTSIIGLIPNCASSVLISTLFINGNIAFGALLSGLLVNSGLGFMVLLKKKASIKQALIILSVCFLISIIFGYLVSLLFGF